MGTGTEGGAPSRRVVIVDNDEITRSGCAALLATSPAITVLAAVGHDEALGWAEEWDRVDVAVVDASDPRRPSPDKFPGVQVVRQLRARRSPDETVAVVLTAQYLHQGLRQRLREAGADFLYPRDDGMTAEELIGVVLEPDQHRRMDGVRIALPAELGVTSSTEVNDVVDRLVGAHLEEALDPHRRKKTDVHGERSRWWYKVRGLAGGPTGLRSVNSEGNTAMDRDLPSVPQLRKFLRSMTEARRLDDE